MQAMPIAVGGPNIENFVVDRLTIRPEDREFAKSVYDCFKSRPDAKHIASEIALAYLSACLSSLRPRKVLELGAGIGTITRALLEHPAGVERIVSTENNDYCISIVRNEILNANTRVTLITSPAELAFFREQADLIVGDGGFYSLEEFVAAKVGTVFFAEGERVKLRTLFAEALEARGLAIEYHGYGGSRWRRKLTWKTVCGLRIPALAHTKRAACWVGLVRRVPVPSLSF